MSASPPPVLCSQTGCDTPIQHLTYCAAHYARWYRYGDPAAGNAPRGSTPLQRFYWYTDIPDDPDACWIWTRGVVRDDGRNDYGVLTIGNGAGAAQQLAHRWAYEHFRGPIAEGLELDHLCRVHRCCNPAHLEPVTHRENCERGFAARGYR